MDTVMTPRTIPFSDLQKMEICSFRMLEAIMPRCDIVSQEYWVFNHITVKTSVIAQDVFWPHLWAILMSSTLQGKCRESLH